jgi:probable rRNA maturation factor
MDIDTLIADERWHDVGIEALAHAAALATLEHLGIQLDAVEISFLACDDWRITELNTEFRAKPGPTNVLSWPAHDLAPDLPGQQPHPPAPDFGGALELGDIAIAYDTCLRESRDLGKSMPDHVSHLFVHGLLHLLGYDHTDDADADLMQGIESEILGKMGLDDPYRE